MIDRWWTIFLTIIATCSAFDFQCPVDHACNCQPSHSGDIEIHCPTEDGAFIVNVLPNEYIQIQCRNSPRWADFHLRNLLFMKNAPRMYFRMCTLPSNTSLGEIAHQIGVETVDRLIFQSFGNLSTTLTRKHLEGFSDVHQLILSSNSLTNLTGDIFANVSHINWLDLRENNVQLSPGLFKNIPDLEVLEVGNNMIKSIDARTFDDLPKLRLLNLWKNRLTELEPGTFDKLVSLKSLDLNTNELTTLPRNIFEKLENLENLNLFANNFTSLPEGLLQSNSKLKTVNLYNNKRNMTFPNGFLANLTSLTEVKLKRNGLVTLPEDLFWGSPSLANVSLERNFLVSLPEKIFKDSKQLTRLELRFNELTSLPENIFSNTPKLVLLDLSKNHFTTVSRHLFRSLKSLEVLNMQENQLTRIDERSFNTLTNLRIANFSDNHLTLNTTLYNYQDEFGISSPFHACTSLEELYLAKNNISSIFSDWTFSNLKLRILDLKYNNLSFITAQDLQFVSSNIKVDLTHNNIQHIFLRSAELVSGLQKISRNVIILVENNPIACDCGLYDFLRYLEGRMHPSVQNYFHIVPGDLVCQGPEWLKDIDVTKLKSKSLKCIIDDAGSELACPQECTCWLKPEIGAVMIDCSYKTLTRVTSNITNLHPERLELNFTGSGLTRMPSLANLGLSNTTVTMMLLSNNNISEISLNGLSKNMESLELHNNNITKVNADVLHFLKNSTSLRTLTLHGNPWNCDCDARDFLNFIQTNIKKIPNSLSITCKNMDGPMIQMTATEFCPPDTTIIVSISLSIALIGLIFGILAALYYRYQREIKVWLYAHQWCLWLVTEDELDKDKQYDAFISYSHKDEEFVVNELVSKLENGPRPFKLCLHFRDWLAGEWIPTQIARSVEDSRRTIVVLSPNFLESVWGRMEFRAAHSQALSEGRARVILILYGEIGPTDELDPELKAYLNMNTYVKWGDPWFWDKLRYALPHPPEFTKNAIRKKIFENHQPCIQIQGEKKELIYPADIPATPPAASTPPADTLRVFICDATNDAAKDSLKETVASTDNGKLILTAEELLKNNLINKVQCTTV